MIIPELCSVIMIVQDGERFLAEAIESVLAQSYAPLELLLVDGGSTDGTAQIARRYPEVRWIDQVGEGVAEAYNSGIRAASGAYIAFLSHDDRWTPAKLRLQISMLAACPELLYTYGRVRFFLEPGCTMPAGFNPTLFVGEHSIRIMEVLVARRAAFTTIGLLNPAFSPADDVDWFARAADLGAPAAEVEGLLLHKRIHDHNTSLHDLARNNHLLMAILRASIARKRAQASAAGRQKPSS